MSVKRLITSGVWNLSWLRPLSVIGSAQIALSVELVVNKTFLVQKTLQKKLILTRMRSTFCLLILNSAISAAKTSIESLFAAFVKKKQDLVWLHVLVQLKRKKTPV